MGESAVHERGWAAVGMEGGGRKLGVQGVSGAGSQRSGRAWSNGDVGGRVAEWGACCACRKGWEREGDMWWGLHGYV